MADKLKTATEQTGKATRFGAFGFGMSTFMEGIASHDWWATIGGAVLMIAAFVWSLLHDKKLTGTLPD